MVEAVIREFQEENLGKINRLAESVRFSKALDCN